MGGLGRGFFKPPPARGAAVAPLVRSYTSLKSHQPLRAVVEIYSRFHTLLEVNSPLRGIVREERTVSFETRSQKYIQEFTNYDKTPECVESVRDTVEVKYFANVSLTVLVTHSL